MQNISRTIWPTSLLTNKLMAGTPTQAQLVNLYHSSKANISEHIKRSWKLGSWRKICFLRKPDAFYDSNSIGV